ncbi:MAG: alpha/beta hydrolase [Spirochaetes bacterium]|nr:alpha/beta hydrolase [Spirochaetota bacterium]
MQRSTSIIFGTIGILFLIVFIVPLVIPVRPLGNTISDAAALAWPESRFTNVNGLNVHYRIAGSGAPAMVLLHGFGASVYSWREVIRPLSAYGTVIAFDYPPFGLTARPVSGEITNRDPFSIASSAALVRDMIQLFGFSNAVLVGNSLGGMLAVVTAFDYRESVTGLVLVDAAIYGGGPPSWLHSLAQFPQVDHIGPLIVRPLQETGVRILVSAWHDSNRVTADIISNYSRPVQMSNWDVALWRFTTAERPKGISHRLKELHLPVLVVSGDDDRLVPMSNSIRLARDIPGARLVIISNCGHVPQEEQPERFLSAVIPFISDVTRRR